MLKYYEHINSFNSIYFTAKVISGHIAVNETLTEHNYISKQAEERKKLQQSQAF